MLNETAVSYPSGTAEAGNPKSVYHRRSDRVSMELPIEVGGSDARGVDFFDQGRTVILSRHGAKIALRRILSPNQELTILCKATGKEAVARVVGELGEGPEGHLYGIAFLNEEANPWDIEFPKLTESESAAARALLECAACHSRKIAYLNASEAEVFEVNRRLSIYCKRCGDSTIWRPALVSSLSAGDAAPAAEAHQSPARVKNERQEPRTRLRMVVCLRHPQLGEEIVETIDISRGGFGFKSRKCYSVGSVMEAALPYSPGQANIFTPICVVHCEKSEEESVFTCGASYVHSR